jgi:hypothetical protein
MFIIKIADINVCIDNKYDYVKTLCKDYIVEDRNAPDITISVTDEEIANEVKLAEFDAPVDYAEGVCVYRKICKQLPIRFNAYLFHSAVIEYEGKGYAFSAKSGTGKSTHIRLWRKHFGEKVHVVNGDKPIMRFMKDELVAYGTPWCGKEGYQNNTSVAIKGICFIERATNNSIKRITPDEAIGRIFHQILTPEDIASVDALFPLLDRTLTQIPCYVLQCNISEEAAQIAYEGMN